MEQIVVPKEDVSEFLKKYGLKLDTVVSVDAGEQEPVWDVSISDTSIPIPHTFIANGIVTHNSASADYLENIMHNMGIKGSVKDIFGVRDEKSGKWLIPPRVRYKSESIAERFFDYLARLERMLPDKKKIGDNWYYIYEDTKENRSIVGNQYDVAYWRKTKRLRVPAADGTLQALLLVDSYPAMLPEKQDVDDPNSAIASQARMFAEQLRRVKGKLRGKRIAVIGVNQLRLKPMVMYGCLHASVKVQFSDGRVHTMKDIVEKRISGSVCSLNETSGLLEFKPITDWHYNGETESKDDWICIKVKNPLSHSGYTTIVVTKIHTVYTQRGWVAARDLTIIDQLFGHGSVDDLSEHAVFRLCDIVDISSGANKTCHEYGKYDISVADNKNYLAGGKKGGVIVHNSPEYETGGEALKLFSDVRMKWSSRALSAVGKDIGETIKGTGQIEEEPCVFKEHGTDNYRYIHVRGHKNKLSRPYLEAWLRLWITNSDGEAQGFDPAFDVYAYLRATGQLSGKRAKMLLQFKGNPATKSINWLTFKRMILGDRAMIKEACLAAGMKPCDLRAKCFAQMASGTGLELYTQQEVVARGAKSNRRAADADVQTGDDDNE